MKQIFISDATLKQTNDNFKLTFKEKIELAKLLDKLGVDIIELEEIKNLRVDSLQIKSISSAVANTCVAVPVDITDDDGVEKAWAALKSAKKPRLQVCVPTSAVQIEYILHKKPEAMLDLIAKTVALAASVCSDVEFVAKDATRSEAAFLTDAINAAISSGAKTVTLCDDAGAMLPAEFAEFIGEKIHSIPALKDVTLGVCCSNVIARADACAIMAVATGATQIRAAAHSDTEASLANIIRTIDAKADVLDSYVTVNMTQLGRISSQIEWLCNSGNIQSNSDKAADNDDVYLTEHDTESSITAAIEKLGYDLSEEDCQKVYSAFKQIAQKKGNVTFKELDAIVASSAMQVPSTYKLDTYVITSGNSISATAHIKLAKNGETLEGVYIGDGSIDAAFQTIEKITGCHYELDDFQLQAVTEGREAMGQTIVKLRAGGKVYAGRGISTDIVGAGIQAYINALNKIVYEEEEE